MGRERGGEVLSRKTYDPAEPTTLISPHIGHSQADYPRQSGRGWSTADGWEKTRTDEMEAPAKDLRLDISDSNDQLSGYPPQSRTSSDSDKSSAPGLFVIIGKALGNGSFGRRGGQAICGRAPVSFIPAQLEVLKIRLSCPHHRSADLEINQAGGPLTVLDESPVRLDGK
ncbi:hypothetical protein BDK51DRAFT_29539 [Blyttiomyces helicus]|uniref:Uncharacterized protein n=1 Tax=Blyttiomyces helicus TaxID=388810 RepID=A0A4P9WSI1_9FUNG|nr:hypothetical protein BDK51DRAFT_29539 [Blyttiomyces helicus]|eukprot:RKO93966.1 hypothetical protein BDK51DRAFT_29539 [Blyttiomyces helicus]